MKIKREENPRAEISWLWMIQTRNFFKLLFQLCSGTKQEQIEPSYLNGDPAYNFQIGGNDYVIYFERYIHVPKDCRSRSPSGLFCQEKTNVCFKVSTADHSEVSERRLCSNCEELQIFLKSH